MLASHDARRRPGAGATVSCTASNASEHRAPNCKERRQRVPGRCTMVCSSTRRMPPRLGALGLGGSQAARLPRGLSASSRLPAHTRPRPCSKGDRSRQFAYAHEPLVRSTRSRTQGSRLPCFNLTCGILLTDSIALTGDGAKVDDLDGWSAGGSARVRAPGEQEAQAKNGCSKNYRAVRMAQCHKDQLAGPAQQITKKRQPDGGD